MTKYFDGHRCYLIPDNYDASFAGYERLKNIAKQDYPHLWDTEIICDIVVKSGWCKKCPIIHWKCSENYANYTKIGSINEHLTLASDL